jgi:hypothetical protein
MQDQLLAESEAAVPAEMVREFQVAGLRVLRRDVTSDSAQEVACNATLIQLAPA